MSRIFTYIFFISIALSPIIPPGKLFAANAYAQLSSIITQVPTSGSGSPVKMEQVNIIKNFTLSPEKDKLIAKEPGVYLAIANGQVGATTPGATGYIDAWITKNGLPIEDSTDRASVDTSTFVGVLLTQFIFELAANDTVGVNFAASGPSIGFIFIKPDNEPGITSFVFSITKID